MSSERGEQLSFLSIPRLACDVRLSIRGLRRSPVFAAVVVLTLAAGIGAVTAVFTLLHGIVLQPLSYRQPDALVAIGRAGLDPDGIDPGIPGSLYFRLMERDGGFDAVGAYRKTLFNLHSVDRGTERIPAAYTSASVFHALGVAPALGRLFTVEDGAPGFMNMRWTIPVLLSHELWRDRFGADPAIVNRVITLSDNPRRVIGVMPEGFVFPDAQTRLWMLLEPPRATASATRPLNSEIIGRLSSGVTIPAAEANAQRLHLESATAPGATTSEPTPARMSLRVISFKSSVIGGVADVLWPLFAGMALLLAIATANAAALFAARAEDRRREIAVRLALGARGLHVVRLFIVEALILSGGASLIGLLVAKGVLLAVTGIVPIDLPRAADVGIGGIEAAFSMGLALAIALLYGALSWRRQNATSSPNPLTSGRSITSDRAGSRAVFLTVQVALVLTLLVGAALMLATYRNLSRRTLGFVPDRVLTIDLGLPSRQATQHVSIYRRVVDRLRQTPGVEDASIASFVPLTPSADIFPVPGSETPVAFKFFVPGYFQAMKSPVVAGETFSRSNPVVTPRGVLLSASLARRLSGQQPLGQPVQRLDRDGRPVQMRGHPMLFTIAGVVGDVLETSLRGDGSDVIYVPIVDPPVELSIIPTEVTVIVRTSGPPVAMTAAVRRAIFEAHPDLSFGRIRTLDDIVAAARSHETFVGALLAAASAVSLLLGIVGIYGSVAHVIRRRAREIGIRLALGATHSELVRLAVAGSLRAVTVGMCLGLTMTLAGGRVLGALLFGVGPRDPAILAGATIVLTTAAVGAALLASRQALRLGPNLVMRGE